MRYPALAGERRLTAARADLAAESLRGVVEARAYAQGEPARVKASSAWLLREPRQDAPLDSEVLYGEALTIYERHEGWAWVQLAKDAYVGYVSEEALAAQAPAPTHRVGVLRSFLFPGASIKLPTGDFLPFGAEVHVTGEKGDFARLADGRYLWREHLRPLDEVESDPVAVAERFLGLPYVWGGRTSLGLDCSGLVQTALNACGIPCPRDSDMQEKVLGEALTLGEDLAGLRRGDLIFWKGHVGLMMDDATLLHATGAFMLVVREPLRQAAARIQSKGEGPITSIRRLAR